MPEVANPLMYGSPYGWDKLEDVGLPVKCHGTGGCSTVYPGHLAYMVVDGLCEVCRKEGQDAAL